MIKSASNGENIAPVIRTAPEWLPSEGKMTCGFASLDHGQIGQMHCRGSGRVTTGEDKYRADKMWLEFDASSISSLPRKHRVAIGYASLDLGHLS